MTQDKDNELDKTRKKWIYLPKTELIVKKNQPKPYRFN